MINSKTIFLRLFTFLVILNSLVVTSCQNEGINLEDQNVGISDENGTGEENSDIFNSDGTLNINTEPSAINLNEVQSGDDIAIEGRIDLNGQNVVLPSNVTLRYNGGEIINGTLDFGDESQSVVDSDLFNRRLSVRGNIRLLQEVFTFRPDRWDIVQGPVDDVTALLNTQNMEQLFLYAKGLGAHTFVIKTFDAYFKVDGPLNQGVPEVHALNLPSDFSLHMTSNTHLRMQPNGHFRAALLSIYNENNVKVTGGNLHGDREQHNYNSGYVDSDGSTGPTNEWLNTMTIKGGKNIIIDGVTFMDAAGDGLLISSTYHYFDPNHIRSENITITNCIFQRARRTNLVITNGEQIYIDHNQLIDGGIDMPNSSGIAPSSNLNIEPYRSRNQTTGELIEYERVSDVYITNNEQIVLDRPNNPSAGGFQLSHGNGPIIVENNVMTDTGVSFTTVDGVIIRNNTITNGAISAGNADNIDRTDFVFGNEVYNNTIQTTGTAMSVGGNGVLVRDNNILQSTVGIAIGFGATNSSKGVSNSIIRNNNIESSNRAITCMNTLHNVTIEQNDIHMTGNAPFAMTLSGISDNFVVKNNTITGSNQGTVSGAPPSLLSNNNLEYSNNNGGEIQISGGSNMLIQGNVSEARINKDGVVFSNDSPNTILSNNQIIIYPSQTPLAVNCIKVNSGINLTGVSLNDNNICIEQ
ncbi:MAG: right-handed parallel beta-helix repeat-containing protein [Flavobacteriaceae bacterium]